MNRGVAVVLALAVALLVLGPLSAFAAVKPDKQGRRSGRTTDADWMRHPHDDKYYNEGWTVIARSDDGHILYLNMLYSNIGVFSGDAYVDHWVQNVVGPHFSTHWWILRMFQQDYSIFFLVIKLKQELGGGYLKWVVVTDRKKVRLFTDRLALKADGKKSDPKGHKYDSRETPLSKAWCCRRRDWFQDARVPW